MTHEKYDNSVGALLRTALRPSSGFPSQARSNGFTTGSAQQTVGELQAEAYFDAAERIAADVVKNVPLSLQCDVALASARGELDEPAGISAQARRMVEDSKARPVLMRLYSSRARTNSTA